MTMCYVLYDVNLGSEVMCTSGYMAKGNATDKITWDHISKSLIMASPPMDTGEGGGRGWGEGVGWDVVITRGEDVGMG